MKKLLPYLPYIIIIFSHIYFKFDSYLILSQNPLYTANFFAYLARSFLPFDNVIIESYFIIIAFLLVKKFFIKNDKLLTFTMVVYLAFINLNYVISGFTVYGLSFNNLSFEIFWIIICIIGIILYHYLVEKIPNLFKDEKISEVTHNNRLVIIGLLILMYLPQLVAIIIDPINWDGNIHYLILVTVFVFCAIMYFIPKDKYNTTLDFTIFFFLLIYLEALFGQYKIAHIIKNQFNIIIDAYNPNCFIFQWQVLSLSLISVVLSIGLISKYRKNKINNQT